jgi:2-desacetyl-2-hydroxyethyl bacteriochlorophyllide A dehydrogenase
MENPTLVFPEAGAVELQDRPAGDPGPDELLVETECTLVSTGTELTILSGEYPEGSEWDEYGTYPFVAGYCNVGTVAAAGADTDFAPGDRVASRAAHRARDVVSADRAVPVPDAVGDEAAAFFALAAIAANGVRRADLAFGDAVAVYGCGLLGQFAARFAREAGARPVVAADVAASRLDFLPEDDAVHAVDPTETDPAAVVEHHHDGLADAVIEATGAPDAIPGQFDALREQGRFVVLSSPRGTTAFDFHDRCNAPGYEIVGAHERTHPPTAPGNWTFTRNAALFFELVAAGEVDAADLVTHRVPAAEAPDTYRSLLADRTDALGVVVDW